ncbi:thioredoxin [Pontiellaceae bacterium B12219]|nr:thioredoxin [Pontiellaceae bacterium B12219]
MIRLISKQHWRRKMAEGVIELSGSNYEEKTKSGVVLVDFWAPWCGPCKMQTPILEKVSAEIGEKAVIAKVNVDENPELAAKYGIRSIPTLILLKDGENTQQFVGLQQQAALVSAIDAAQ